MGPTRPGADDHNDSALAKRPARRFPSWLWLAAAVALLAFPIRFWTKPVGRAMLNPPSTPLDRISPDAAAMWTFLRQAAPHVPEGSAFTVRAPGLDQEMELFMLAHGTVRHASPVPSSYYGRPVHEIGARAEYVLAYRWHEGSCPDLVEVATLGDGKVLRRARTP